MTHVYRRELERALEEMGFAVRGWEMEDSPAAGARARVRTLEGKAVEIECVNDGFLVSRRAVASRGFLRSLTVWLLL